jgi:hypothetical protein
MKRWEERAGSGEEDVGSGGEGAMRANANGGDAWWWCSVDKHRAR